MNCPSCGAKIDIVPGIVSYVCPYCNTISVFERESLVSTGEKSSITPFPTKLEYGKNFYIVLESNSNSKLLGKKVEYFSEKDFNDKKIEKYLCKIYVYAQIRYISENGIYNKFFIRILDDKLGLNKEKDYFIEEDEGQIKMYKLDFVNKDGTFTEMFDTDKPYLHGFFIQEKGIQNIEGFKGGFHFNIVGLKQTKYLNLVVNRKNFLLEEYVDKILYGEGI